MTPIPLGIKKETGEQSTESPTLVTLPGVRLSTLTFNGNVFNGLNLHRDNSQRDFARIEQQNRANLISEDPRYAQYDAQGVRISTRIESNIRDVIPSNSRVVINDVTVRFEESNRTSGGFDKIGIESVRDKIVDQLKGSLEETKTLSSGKDDLLKASLIESSLIPEKVRVISTEDKQIIILKKNDEPGKTIEIRIPIPENSGFKRPDNMAVFSSDNKEIQHNLNILGALLTNIKEALTQLQKAQK